MGKVPILVENLAEKPQSQKDFFFYKIEILVYQKASYLNDSNNRCYLLSMRQIVKFYYVWSK